MKAHRPGECLARNASAKKASNSGSCPFRSGSHSDSNCPYRSRGICNSISPSPNKLIFRGGTHGDSSFLTEAFSHAQCFVAIRLCRSCGIDLTEGVDHLGDSRDKSNIQAIEDAYRTALLGFTPTPALLGKAKHFAASRTSR